MTSRYTSARLMPGGTLGLSSSLRLGPVLCLALGGCMVGPDYDRPPAIVSLRFKELQPPPGWVRAAPQLPPRGDWWRIYNDPVLDALEAQVAISNQNVKVSEADYRQAQVDRRRGARQPVPDRDRLARSDPAVDRAQHGHQLLAAG